jgi:acyl-coenzyme A thioesterase PaaI-like protein
VACGRVVKAGRRQVFTSAELSAEADGSVLLVASGQTILVPTGGQQ